MREASIVSYCVTDITHSPTLVALPPLTYALGEGELDICVDSLVKYITCDKQYLTSISPLPSSRKHISVADHGLRLVLLDY